MGMTREEVISTLEVWIERDNAMEYADRAENIEIYKMAIKALEQTRPKGTWIFKNDNIAIPTGYYQCSECKEGKLLVKDNFCPNCGADMRESGANVDE